jgi:spore coat polysaccharide biosynthesis protein SpsF
MYNGRKEKIVAIIEARMTSTRLPGKVLLPLGGTTVLGLLIERLKRSRYLDAICVATTVNATDKSVAALAKELGVECFRGSEADVLGRVLGAVRATAADIIVEITGDCPFTDHRVVDRGIEEFFIRAVDYVSNTLSVTYPHGGFEVQVFPTSVLAEVDTLTNDPVDRTHVSYYIYQHPEKYRLYNFEAPLAARAPELRVVLDEKDDYTLITKVFSELYPRNPDFSVEDVVHYLRAHPDVAMLNKNVKGKKAHEL